MSTLKEKDIQDYIWENKNNLCDLIESAQFPDEINSNEPWKIKPYELIFNLLLKECKKYLNSLKNNLSLFASELSLEKENESTIRLDLLGLLESENGLCIIEVKKSKQTERQAFTELLAYSSHLKQIFMPLSNVDIAHILIAPMESRIVRESILNGIVYERKFTFALIPIHDGKNINSLKLRPWIPSLEEIKDLSNISFCEENFDVCKIVWENKIDIWNPEKGENPDNFMKSNMNLVSQYAAQVMETKGIHGFVYSSQDWSEKDDFLPNAIVMVGLNPFKATKNRIMMDKYPSENFDEIKKANIDNINMMDIFPKIKQKEVHQRDNLFVKLSDCWSNELGMIGLGVIKKLSLNCSKKPISTDIRHFEWKNCQSLSSENVTCHKFNLYTTGLIREIVFEYLEKDYQYIKNNTISKHPIYQSEGISEFGINMVFEYWFVVNYILPRLYNQDFYNDY